MKQLLFTGFNAFEQWPGSKSLVESFTEIKSTPFISLMVDNWRSKVCLQWCYNITLQENNILITGFYGNTQKMITKANLKFDVVGGNDKHILFVNGNVNVWKLLLYAKDQLIWKPVPRFVGVESCTKDAGDDKKETIIKLCCGETMNLALTDRGNLFDIPSKIVDCNNFEGKVTDIACGYEHAILLTESGNIYTWGGGSRCQLGHGDICNRDHPELVEALAGIVIKRIAAGGWHSCAVSECGDLYSWGWNDKGQIGFRDWDNRKDGKMIKTESESFAYFETKDEDQCTNYPLPMLIEFYESPADQVDRNVVDLACGSKHTVVKLDDGSIWASGWNQYGQLGLSHNISNLRFFQLVKQGMAQFEILCGPWSTVLLNKC